MSFVINPHPLEVPGMKKYGWPFIIAAGLVILAHYLFNQPFGGSEWQSVQGIDQEGAPRFTSVAFAAEYVGWTAYCFFYIWLYRKVQYVNVMQAMGLSVMLWAFIAFPVVTVHYIFLDFSTTLIILDGVSTLVCMLAAGNLLWAFSIHTIPPVVEPVRA
jgi:hypothetical protein